MNLNFHKIIGANFEDRRGLFLATANRLGAPLQNVEKDFWVSWVLDLLFNGKGRGEPRLLFKGGTSLSKAYGLINRFSEDLDITVFREDLTEEINFDILEKLSGKQQRIHMEKIKQASQHYINGKLKDRLNHHMTAVFQSIQLKFDGPFVTQDLSDNSQQTLLVNYPSVSINSNDYIKPTVKIEAGAKSALDPHTIITLQPYAADDIPDISLLVENVVTINAERTFWDKVMILHGLRRWHDKRNELRQQGHRISRHYYDVYQLIHSSVGQKTKNDFALALDCARHAQVFFNSSDLDLLHARKGSFALMPTPLMQQTLKRDYQAMSSMIFGKCPDFIDVLKTIEELEVQLNQID